MLFTPQIAPEAFKAQYAVARDGRFLINNLATEEATAPPITIVLNRR